MQIIDASAVFSSWQLEDKIRWLILIHTDSYTYMRWVNLIQVWYNIRHKRICESACMKIRLGYSSLHLLAHIINRLSWLHIWHRIWCTIFPLISISTLPLPHRSPPHFSFLYIPPFYLPSPLLSSLMYYILSLLLLSYLTSPLLPSLLLR